MPINQKLRKMTRSAPAAVEAKKKKNQEEESFYERYKKKVDGQIRLTDEEVQKRVEASTGSSPKAPFKMNMNVVNQNLPYALKTRDNALASRAAGVAQQQQKQNNELLNLFTGRAKTNMPAWRQTTMDRYGAFMEKVNKGVYDQTGIPMALSDSALKSAPENWAKVRDDEKKKIDELNKLIATGQYHYDEETSDQVRDWYPKYSRANSLYYDPELETNIQSAQAIIDQYEKKTGSVTPEEYETAKGTLAGYQAEKEKKASGSSGAIQRFFDQQNEYNTAGSWKREEYMIRTVYDTVNGKGAYEARTKGMSETDKAALDDSIWEVILENENPEIRYMDDLATAQSRMRYAESMIEKSNKEIKNREKVNSFAGKSGEELTYERRLQEIDDDLANIEWLGLDNPDRYARYQELLAEREQLTGAGAEGISFGETPLQQKEAQVEAARQTMIGQQMGSPEWDAANQEYVNLYNEYQEMLKSQQDVAPGQFNQTIIPEAKVELDLDEGYKFHPQGNSAQQAYFWANYDNYDWGNQELYGNSISDINKMEYARDPRNIREEMFMSAIEVGGRNALEMFNEYYGSGTEEEQRNAMAFLDALRPTLRQLRATYQEEYDREKASGNLGALYGLATFPKNIWSGLVGIARVGAAALGDEAAQDPNSTWGDTARNVSVTRDETGDVVGDTFANWFGEWARGIGKDGMGILYSIGDNIAAMAGTKLISAAAGIETASKAAERVLQFIMSSEALGSTFQEELENDTDPTKAAVLSIADFVFSWYTENMGWDALMNADVKEMMGHRKDIVKYIAKTAGAETGEEISEFAMSWAFENIVDAISGQETKDQKEVDRLINEEKMDPWNAEHQVFMNNIREAGKRGIAGGISGGLMAGGRYVSNTASQVMWGKNVKNAKSLGENGGINRIVDIGAGMAEDTQSKQLADEIKADMENGKKPSSFDLGRLAQNIIHETNEKVGSVIRDVLSMTVKKELTDAGVSNEEAEAAAEVVAKARVEGLNMLTRAEKEIITRSEKVFRVLGEFMSNVQKTFKTESEIRAGTKDELAVRQEVEDLITPEKAKTSEGAGAVADAYKDAGQYTADGTDIALAKGKRTGGADAIVDGEFRQITGIKDGKVLVADGKGNTAELEIGEIKATNRNVAALISFTGRHSGLISDRYATKALEVVANMKKNLNGPKVLDDIVKIRMAGMTEGALPATTLDTKAAEGLYQEAQAEFEEEDAKRIKKQPVVTPGKGRLSFQGVSYGTNAFEEAAKSLSKRARETARVLGEIATRMGFTVNLINNPDISETFGWEDEATGAVTINLAGQRTRSDMQHILATAGHEFTHWLEQNSAEGYKSLRSFIFDTLRKTGKSVNSMVMQLMDERNALATEQGEGTTVSLFDAVKELVANSCDQVLGNQKVIDELANTDQDLFDKAKTYMRNFLSRLKNALQGLGESTTRESRALRGFYDELSGLWVSALNEARGRQAGGTEGTETRMAQAQKAGTITTNGIEAGMSDAERYAALKGTRIAVPIVTFNAFSLSEARQYNQIKEKPLQEKALRRLALKLGLTDTGAAANNKKLSNKYLNNLQAEFNNKSIRETVSKGSIGTGLYAALMHNLEEVYREAVPIMVEGDRYVLTQKEKSQTTDFVRLLGGFRYNGVTLPVEFDVKKNIGESNKLYIVASINKEDALDAPTVKRRPATYETSPTTISIEDLIGLVNKNDRMILPSIPAQLLNKQQQIGKRAGLEEQGRQIANKKKNAEGYINITDERVDRIIRQHKNQNAYVAYISPSDFVKLAQYSQKKNANESRQLIATELRGEESTPTIWFDQKTGKVIRADGSKRMQALDYAEAKKIPVVFVSNENTNGSRESIESIRLTGELARTADIQNLVPADSDHRQELIDTYGTSENWFRYSMAQVSQEDKAYADAVERGDLETATAMLMDKLKHSENIIPFNAPAWYGGQHKDIAQMIKNGTPEAVARAAERMASFVPDNGVLVPMPPHEGKVLDDTDTKILADAISELTGRPVVVALESDPRESRYEAKSKGKKGVKAEDMGFRQVAEIPEGTIPIFVDNVVGSGETAKAAMQAMGGGITLAYAKSSIARSPGIQGLKRAVVTYDNDKKLIPLSQRFDASIRDIRYAMAQDGEEMTFDSLDIPRDVFFKGTDAEISAAEQKEEARINEFRKLIDNDNFVALEYTHPDGRTEILTRSIRPGVRYQLSYIGSDGIPNMHESYGESGDGKNTTENIHSMDELYRHLVNENSRRELKMTVLRETNGKKYSMAQRSEEYNQAVRSGDMETAQRLVDEAAEAAMPNSKIRGKDGKLLRVYHGTEEMFYEFDTSKHGGEHGTAEGYGIYLTDTQDVSEKYGSRQISGYVNITRPAYSDRRTLKKAELVRLIKAACEQEARTMVEDGEADSMKQALPNTWISNYVYTPEYRSINDAYAAVAESFLRMHDNDSDIVKEVVFGMGINSYKEAMDFYHNILTPTTGIDGIWEKWGTEEDRNLVNIFLAFNSSQIKEADPVTYDDNGKIIPLDERFDQKKADIRYAMAQSDMDVRVWMQNLTEEMLVTEQEKNMLKQYKNQRMAVDIDRKMINDQNAIIRKIKAKGTITPYDRSELIKAQNILQNYENKLQRDEEALAKVTSSEGYAALMYKQSKLMNDLVNGRTAEEVMQTVEAIQRKIAGVDREMKENEERLNRLAGAEGVVAAKTWFAGKGLRETAQRLKKNFLSSLNLQEIENRLASIALRLNQNGYNAEEVMDDVTTLAEMLADKTKAAGDQSYILQELRGSIFYLNKAQMKELSGTHRTLKDINRELAGTGIKFREAKAGDTTLDQVYDQLRETIPSLPDTTDTQMADELLDLIKRERRSEAENIINSNMGEVIQAVFEEAMTLAPTKNAGQANKAQVETMIKYISELAGEARKSAEVMNALQATVKKLSQEATSAREGARRLDLNIGDAIKYFNTLTQQSEAVIWRGERAKLISQLKDEKTKALIAEQQKWRDRIEKDKNVRNKMADNARIRSMITVNTSRLRKLLEAETDQKNVPEHMKGLAWEMLRMIVGNDLGESRRKITNTEKKKLERTQQVLNLWTTENGDFDVKDLKAISDAEAQNVAEEALADIEDGILFYNASMGKDIQANVQGLYNALDRILKGVTNIMQIIQAESSVMFNDRRIAVQDAADDVREGMNRSRFRGEYTGKTRKAREMFKKSIISGNTTPVYFFKNLLNSGMDNLWHEIERGENRNGLELQKAKAYIDRVAEITGYSTWDLDKKYDVTLSGKTVKMTLEQMMALYATWMREQTVGPEMSSHLKLGGVYIDDGSMNEGFAGRKKVDARANRVTDDDAITLGNMLTAEQHQYITMMVNYLSKEMSDLGNEASMKMYGIKKYNEKYYFPMQIWDGVKSARSDKGISGTDENRAAHRSWSKRRINKAKNALVIGNFTDIATKHIVEMINYVTMAPAIENINKVMNVQVDDGMGETLTKRNIRAMFQEAYGREALSYLENFLKDLNGGTVQDQRKTLQERALSLFKKNAVAGSLSVAVQQPLSYIRAAMMLNPKHLAEGLKPSTWKGSYAEMVKYSGVAVIKDMGRFDMGFGQSAKEYLTPDQKKSRGRAIYNKAVDLTTMLPELMDRMTWTRMWAAVKAEQHDMNPGMDMKSDEFLKKAAERFNELMRRTQVYDSVLVKSSNMRSQNYALKLITSFMAEPTLTLNVLGDAVANVKEKGGKTVLAKAGATFLISAVLQAVVKALISTGRSPDKKKNWWENFMYRFGYNVVSEANPVSMIPGYSDLIETLKSGELKDDAMGAIGKLKTIWDTAWNAAQGNGKGWYRDIEDSVAQLAQLFTNIPAKNLMRDLRATINWASPGTYAGRETSGAVLKYQAIDTAMNADNMLGLINSMLGDAGYQTTNSAYYKRIYQAEKTGNSQGAKDMIEYLLKGRGVSEKTISTEFSKAAKADKDLTADQKAELVAGRTGKDPNAVWFEMDKAEYTDAGGTSTATTYYRLDDAIAANKAEDIRKAVTDLTSHGVDKKKIKDHLSSLKEKYLAADNAEKVRIRDAMEKTYKALGYDAAEVKTTIEKWNKAGNAAAQAEKEEDLMQRIKAGTVTDSQAIKELKAANPALTDNAAWYELDRIRFQNETGKDPGGQTYYRLYDAVENRNTKNLKKIVSDMVAHGVKQSNIANQLMTKYGEEYMKLSGNEQVRLKNVLIEAMKAAGQKDPNAYINKWVKRNRNKKS